MGHFLSVRRSFKTIVRRMVFHPTDVSYDCFWGLFATRNQGYIRWGSKKKQPTKDWWLKFYRYTNLSRSNLLTMDMPILLDKKRGGCFKVFVYSFTTFSHGRVFVNCHTVKYFCKAIFYHHVDEPWVISKLDILI